MEKWCYALSRRAGGFCDMMRVTDGDYLYRFQQVCPEWVEPCEIIFDIRGMREVWQNEADLWVILPGQPPLDEVQAKREIIRYVFNPLIPLALLRVVTFSDNSAGPGPCGAHNLPACNDSAEAKTHDRQV